MKAPGYMVWNPNGHVPTYVHETFDGALREARRLKDLNPADRFFVMAPAIEGVGVSLAMAWSDGRQEGLAQSRQEIMQAEAHSDRWSEELAAARRELARLKPIADQLSEFQSIIADCQCWFDGFLAAHGGKESRDRPSTPDVSRIRALNIALRNAAPPPVLETDEEIPF